MGEIDYGVEDMRDDDDHAPRQLPADLPAAYWAAMRQIEALKLELQGAKRRLSDVNSELSWSKDRTQWGA